MSWNTDDLRQDSLRAYESKIAARDQAMMLADTVASPSAGNTQAQAGSDTGPDAGDGIDEAGNDTLTGQPILSSWLSEQPWARDEGGTPVHLAAADGKTATDVPPDYWEATKTIGKSLVAQVPAGLAGLVTLARGKGMGAAADTIEGVSAWLADAWDTMPQTPEGRAALEKLVPLLEKLGAPAQKIGGAVLDATGSPAAATAAEIALDPLNYVVPAAGAAVKGVSKAAKAVSRAGIAAATAGVAVATSGDAEALPLSSLVAKAIRGLPRTAAKPEIEAAMRKADPKINPDKAAKYSQRAEAINREVEKMAEHDVLWKGDLGQVEVGHPEFGGYHIMLEHRGDLQKIMKEAGTRPADADRLSNTALLRGALNAMSAGKKKPDGTLMVGKLSVKIVMKNAKTIGTFYVVRK